jgi:hypothetical protein
MSLQMLPFASFFLFFLVILLLFPRRICDANEKFLSFPVIWSNKKIKHLPTSHQKKLHRDGLQVSEENTAKKFFPPTTFCLTYFTIEKPVFVHFAGKRMKITLLQFSPLLLFFFSSPYRHEKLEIAENVVSVSLAGVKSGAGQDSRLIKNSPAHFSRQRRYSSARVRQEEKLLFQKLTRVRRQEFSKI